MKKGILIAIEGIDGTGKGTQAGMLVEALRCDGYEADLFSFPAYRETFAGQLVGAYLNGALGNPREIDSRLTAAIYAIDRFEMREKIMCALNAGHVVVCDRYVGSNLAHQVARAAPRKRPEVREFIQHLEFQVFQMPRPSLVIFFEMPIALARERILQKSARVYTKKKLDENEADLLHLKKSMAEYRYQVRLNPEWTKISTTTRGGKGRDKEAIHQEVMACVRGVFREKARE